MRTALPMVALLLASCATEPVALSLDVVSDWSPGIDFSVVTVELSRAPFDSVDPGEVRQESFSVTGTEDFIGGVRVAEFTDVGTGRIFLRVSLDGPDGATLARRVVDLTLASSFAATVLLTRSCESVACPAPAGSPALSQCQAGECVDPRCAPSTPEYCDITPCDGDDDCALDWCGGTSLCRAGGCLCDDVPVVVDSGTSDATLDAALDTGCPAVEDACTDGADNDCDGLIDCADPDCGGTGIECTPGQVDSETVACGRCDSGTMTRTRACVAATCMWGAFEDGACTGQSGCIPGSRVSGCDRNGGGDPTACGERVCGADCTLGSCRLAAGARCLSDRGGNYQCCTPSGGGPGWQFCNSATCRWHTCASNACTP